MKNAIAQRIAVVVTICLVTIMIVAALPTWAAMALCDAVGGDRREQNMLDAVRVTANVTELPPQITLQWEPHTSATGYNIYRKARSATAWGSPTTISVTTSYTDTALALGDSFEYRVERLSGDLCASQSGYIYAGVAVPLVEERGKVVLLVDDRFTTTLESELARLESDLIGDGWQVIRHDLSMSSTVTATKAVIASEYAADPANVNSVFIFGHLPVPYSGNHSIDGHQLKAFPADVFYGDMDGVWTDTTVNNAGAENPNVPNDGVYDQVQLLASADSADHTPELAVGRVDLFNMPAFSESEETLLRRYLDKDHAFRHKQISVLPRAWISDNLGKQFGWETPGIGMWHSLVPLVGSNTYTSDVDLPLETTGIYRSHFHPYDQYGVDLADPIYGANANTPEKNYDDGGFLFLDANSTGSYEFMLDSGSTNDYTFFDPPIIFNVLFGSFFGDWDTTNNFMRATLGQQTYGLGSVWSVWGAWQFHHMGLGEPIGNSIVATHNSTIETNGEQLYNLYYDYTTPEMSFLGDPTLRIHIVAPPTELTATGAILTWANSAETVQGYHVYRANPVGTFVRLTPIPISTTLFTDPTPPEGEATYMVRAVKLETTPSGSYYNASQGAFVTTTVEADATAIELTAVTQQPSHPTNILTALSVLLLLTITTMWQRVEHHLTQFEPSNQPQTGETGESYRQKPSSRRIVHPHASTNRVR